MPGALPVFVGLLVVALVALLAAWSNARNPALHDPREDFRLLQRHAAWLEQRLDLARREHWGAEMITSLSDQLGTACQQLAQAHGGVIERKARHLH